MEPSPAPLPVTGIRRLLFAGGGIICVGLAYMGVLLPGLPTTPFLILASYCFLRSSPRLHRWLHRSPIFGRLLSDWETHRGMRRPVKILAISTIVVVVSLSIAFGGLANWLRFLVGGLAIAGITTILLVRTVREPSASS